MHRGYILLGDPLMFIAGEKRKKTKQSKNKTKKNREIELFYKKRLLKTIIIIIIIDKTGPLPFFL